MAAIKHGRELLAAAVAVLHETELYYSDFERRYFFRFRNRSQLNSAEKQINRLIHAVEASGGKVPDSVRR